MTSVETLMTSVAIQTQLSPEEYITRERKAITKSEFVSGKIVAMADASYQHTVITMNISGELYGQLKDRECTVHTTDMRVKASATSSYFYPDIVVVCDKPRFEDNTFDILLNPIVIIEVLSPSTEDYDRIDKFSHYQKLKTLQEYILVSQDEVHVEHYQRHGTLWKPTEFRSLENVLSLPSIACELFLTDIYRRIDFTENQ